MAVVLDTNVFLRGRASSFEQVFTVPEVVEELESREGRRTLVASDVEVEDPPSTAIEKVDEKSDEINSPTSDTDERLVALALHLDAGVVSDDKALQNLASHLEVAYSSFMGEEIRERRAWRKECENCGSQIKGEKCPACGSTDFTLKPYRCS